MSFEFLAPGAATDAVARSPMERQARALGARFERSDGWDVAVEYTGAAREAETCRRIAGWADVSHWGKLELQGPAADLDELAPEPGRAHRGQGAWWCRVTPERALVLCEPANVAPLRERLDAGGAATWPSSLVEVTTSLAALTVAGPQAREIFARFTALDLRPHVTPVGAVRPGSIARQPAILLREAPDRFTFLFGWAVGQYMWDVVADAAQHLGAAPIGARALAAVGEVEEAQSRA